MSHIGGPCFGCVDRTVDCHCEGKCPGDRYKKFKEALEAEHDLEKKQKMEVEITMESIARNQKKSKTHKRRLR